MNRRRRIMDSLALAGLVIWALFWLVPLLWTVAVAFRPPDSPLTNSNLWYGGGFSLDNFKEAWDSVPFGQYYVNTLIIVGGVLIVQMITVTLAGYAFARRKMPGREALFMILLTQILIPTGALIIPNYATIRSLHLYDSRLAVMLPFFASAFGTFLMRQTFRQVPIDLEEAARLDGANWLQTLRHIYLPAAQPALVAFGMVSVIFHWNDFLWPLIVLNSDSKFPLTVGVAKFTQMGESGAQWSLLTAGTLLVIAPLLIVFLIFQRQFVSSMLKSGMK
jgi:sn-glycerol 3-phosphate transport system permease protein